MLFWKVKMDFKFVQKYKGFSKSINGKICDMHLIFEFLQNCLAKIVSMGVIAEVRTALLTYVICVVLHKMSVYDEWCIGQKNYPNFLIRFWKFIVFWPKVKSIFISFFIFVGKSSTSYGCMYLSVYLFHMLSESQKPVNQSSETF